MTATLYKNPEYEGTVETEGGAPFPDAGLPGIAVPLSDYYADLVYASVLLTREEPNGNSTTPKTGALTEIELDGSNDYSLLVANTGVAREAVYVDGAFVAPYVAGSTLVGDNYSVSRAGGWPDGSTVAVAKRFTGTPVPTGGQPWEEIYGVDFTALANQSLATVGAQTIDGKVWWAKGALTGQPNGNSQTNDLVNGAGLRFTSSGVGSAFLAGGAFDYLFRMMFLPFSQIEDYNPLAPVMVRWRGPYSGSDSLNAIGGLVSTANDGANVLAADRAAELLAATGDQTTSASPWFKRGIAALAAGADYGAGKLRGELAVARYLGELTAELRASITWPGAFGDPSTLVAETGLFLSAAKPTRSNPGVGFCMVANGAGTVTISHLSIWQPKVA